MVRRHTHLTQLLKVRSKFICSVKIIRSEHLLIVSVAKDTQYTFNINGRYVTTFIIYWGIKLLRKLVKTKLLTTN